jgi:hypothetical protein
MKLFKFSQLAMPGKLAMIILKNSGGKDEGI